MSICPSRSVPADATESSIDLLLDAGKTAARGDAVAAAAALDVVLLADGAAERHVKQARERSEAVQAEVERGRRVERLDPGLFDAGPRVAEVVEALLDL